MQLLKNLGQFANILACFINVFVHSTNIQAQIVQKVDGSNNNNGNKYILLTKHEVKMAGYWIFSLTAFLLTETRWRFIATRKENVVIIQLS